MGNGARVDEAGRAFAGSQRHIQTYVNERTEQLIAAVSAALPELESASIQFVSPLERDNYAERRDAEFLRALGLGSLENPLTSFWPRGGPVWDALATVEFDQGQGVILLEAKSYVDELYGQGSNAKDDALETIRGALRSTQSWLGADGRTDWSASRLYQYANRLAHLYFLREVTSTPAWLVNCYFVNDPRHATSREDFDAQLPSVATELGISRPVPYTANLFLPAPGL